MKLIFPGTGSGKTSLNYYHSSLVIKNSETILIDCGDSVSRALLQCKIKPNDIDKIIISHLHADHFSGLTSLMTQMKLTNRRQQLKILAPEELIPDLKNFIRTANLFPESFDFELLWQELKFNNPVKLNEETELITFKNNHIRNKYNLTNYPEHKFVSASFKFISDKLNFFYTSDLNDISDFDNFDLYDINLLISEITHISFEEILKVIQKFNIPQTILTHIPDEERIELAKKINSKNIKNDFKIHLAEDGMFFK